MRKFSLCVTLLAESLNDGSHESMLAVLTHRQRVTSHPPLGMELKVHPQNEQSYQAIGSMQRSRIAGPTLSLFLSLQLSLSLGIKKKSLCLRASLSPLYFCRAAAHACPSLSLVILLHRILSLFHYLCRQQLRAARGAAAERGRRRRAAAAPEEPRCGAATVCGADGTEQPWRGASAQSSGGERGRRRRAVRGGM